jgi:hypothetical protein
MVPPSRAPRTPPVDAPQGGRDSGSIVNFAVERWSSLKPPPEVGRRARGAAAGCGCSRGVGALGVALGSHLPQSKFDDSPGQNPVKRPPAGAGARGPGGAGGGVPRRHRPRERESAGGTGAEGRGLRPRHRPNCTQRCARRRPPIHPHSCPPAPQSKPRQLCMFAFLPDILDTGAKGRNAYLTILKDLAAKWVACGGWGRASDWEWAPWEGRQGPQRVPHHPQGSRSQVRQGAVLRTLVCKAEGQAVGLMETPASAAAAPCIALSPALPPAPKPLPNPPLCPALSAPRYKARPFGYVWAEGGKQPQIEAALGVGGFGYPALVAFNPKDAKLSTMRRWALSPESGPGRGPERNARRLLPCARRDAPLTPRPAPRSPSTVSSPLPPPPRPTPLTLPAPLRQRESTISSKTSAAATRPSRRWRAARRSCRRPRRSRRGTAATRRWGAGGAAFWRGRRRGARAGWGGGAPAAVGPPRRSGCALPGLPPLSSPCLSKSRPCPPYLPPHLPPHLPPPYLPPHLPPPYLPPRLPL